mmetsp:Transcript_23281/g.37451  ORF Transcript_23281/g.37451 Transcript_23281/m.37451 type:complete len:96 (+) Transcript_23281:659-946(+)
MVPIHCRLSSALCRGSEKACASEVCHTFPGTRWRWCGTLPNEDKERYMTASATLLHRTIAGHVHGLEPPFLGVLEYLIDLTGHILGHVWTLECSL